MPIFSKKNKSIIITFSFIFLAGLGLFALYGYPVYDFTQNSAYYTSFSIDSYSNDSLGTIHLENGSYSIFIRDSFITGSSWHFVIKISDVNNKSLVYYLTGANTQGTLLYGSGGSSGTINTNVRYNGLIIIPQDSVFKFQIINKTFNSDYSFLVGLKKGDFSNTSIIGEIGFFIAYFGALITFYGIPFIYILYTLNKKRLNKKQLQRHSLDLPMNTGLLNQTDKTRYCSFCGSAVDINDFYCSNCGEILT